MAFSGLHFHASRLAHLHLVIRIACLPSSRKESKRPSIPRVLNVLSDSICPLVVADSFDGRFWVSVLPSFLLNQILPVFMTNRGGFAITLSTVYPEKA